MRYLLGIDPGHGGIDNGASHGFVDEDDTNLGISYFLDYELSALGINHFTTRDKDEYVSLEQRVVVSNMEQPKLFLSIHCDAFHNQTSSGMTVHVYDYASVLTYHAARIIVEQLKYQFPKHRHRGIKKSNFKVLRNTSMPAVLVECEFLSNPITRGFLKKPENQRDLARVLKRSCIKYLDFIGD